MDPAHPTLFDPSPYTATPGFVYAVLLHDGIVKIGYSIDPKRRARELRARLLGFQPGSFLIGREIHFELRAYRIGAHEDFWPSDDVWAVVDESRHDAGRVKTPSRPPAVNNVGCAASGSVGAHRLHLTRRYRLPAIAGSPTPTIRDIKASCRTPLSLWAHETVHLLADRRIRSRACCGRSRCDRSSLGSSSRRRLRRARRYAPTSLSRSRAGCGCRRVGAGFQLRSNPRRRPVGYPREWREAAESQKPTLVFVEAVTIEIGTRAHSWRRSRDGRPAGSGIPLTHLTNCGTK